MIIGTLWLGTPAFALFGKHYCINCGTQLELVKMKKFVKRGSIEEKRYNYEGYGDFNVVWTLFQCPHCNKKIEAATQLSYEAHVKRVQRTTDILNKISKDISIDKVWIDQNGITTSFFSILENTQSNPLFRYIFRINLGKHNLCIPISEAKRQQLREMPFKIRKDKEYKGAMRKATRELKDK